MRPLAIPIAIAAFLPAACSNATSEPEPQQETADPPVEMPTDSRAQTASPANQPAEAKISPDAIPNRFIGVWDYIKGTCDPASDMRLEIGQAEFGFYESHGRVTGIRNEGEATIVDLDMSGEGETWTESLRLVLKEDGTRLHVTEPQKESDEDDYPRRRCPA